MGILVQGRYTCKAKEEGEVGGMDGEAREGESEVRGRQEEGKEVGWGEDRR